LNEGSIWAIEYPIKIKKSVFTLTFLQDALEYSSPQRGSLYGLIR